MSPGTIGKLIGGAILIFVLVTALASLTYVVEPGFRGVEVTLGKVSVAPKAEGFGFKIPFITDIKNVSVRQQTAQFDADCYSSDLQQIKISIRILYRIPEGKVVTIFRDYSGDPFASLIQPRIAEALKELTALRTAEVIVQKREEIKTGALQSGRQKIGDLMLIDDLVIEDISLSGVLEKAIESKMVMEQEAARARFAQQQAEVEANTVVIKARGEAESINLRGKALRENPSILDLQVVEHWDGNAPLIVGPGVSGSNMILPLQTELPAREPAP